MPLKVKLLRVCQPNASTKIHTPSRVIQMLVQSHCLCWKSINKVWITEGRFVWLDPLRRREGWSEQFWRFWREEANFLKNFCWKLTFDLSPPVGALGHCSRLVPLLAFSCQLCGMWDAHSIRGSSYPAAFPSHCCPELLRLLLWSVSEEVLTFTGF